MLFSFINDNKRTELEIIKGFIINIFLYPKIETNFETKNLIKMAPIAMGRTIIPECSGVILNCDCNNIGIKKEIPPKVEILINN